MLREIEQAKQQASHAKFGIVFLKLVYFHSHVSHNFSYRKEETNVISVIATPFPYSSKVYLAKVRVFV